MLVKRINIATGEITEVEVPDVVIEDATSVPQIISDRQFFQELAVRGIIPKEEALSAVKTGTLPAKLQVLVDALPLEAQFEAEMLLSGATDFHRDHPLVAAIGASLEEPMDAAALDAFWIAASRL